MTQFPYKQYMNKQIISSIKHSMFDINIFFGKSIFVTGGTGFFGIWLLLILQEIKRQLRGNLDIIVLSRSPSLFITKYSFFNFNEFIFVEGDVKNFSYRGQKPTHLIHMATTNAAETFTGEDQLRKIKTLFLGTENVLQQISGNLETVLFTSSGVAYGRVGNQKIAEDGLSHLDTLDLGTALGIGKISAEYLISYYSKIYKYNFSIARCFSFAGEFLPLDLHYAFGNFIRDAMSGRDIVIQGDGLQRRSYLYIGDAMAWILAMLAKPTNDIMNVGSEREISILQLAELISKRAKNPIRVVVEGKGGGAGNFDRGVYVPSNQKIKKIFPYLDEWTNISSIIDRMLIFPDVN